MTALLLVPLFESSLLAQNEAFRELEKTVPPPVAVDFSQGYVLRYQEKTVQQAIIAKLARILSLQAACIELLKLGFVQELGILDRCLNDSQQDLTMLCAHVRAMNVSSKAPDPDASATESTPTRYLKWFWHDMILQKDEPHPGEIMRRKVLSHASATGSISPDVAESMRAAFRELQKANSAYVHGSMTPIMELYGGMPPYFHTMGMQGTPKVPEYEHNLWNSIYRSALCMFDAGYALGLNHVGKAMAVHSNDLATAVGKFDLLRDPKLLK